MAKLSTCYLMVILFLVSIEINAQRKNKKSPLELLKDQWGKFDFHFSDDWEVERMNTFLLKTEEFVEDYYEIIKDSMEIDEEIKKNDLNLCRQFLIIEFNHHDLEKKVYGQDWQFDLEVQNKDKNRCKFKPVKVDTTETLKGEEMITGFHGIQPATVIKKRGQITEKKITPTFWSVEKSNLWNKTYIVYFPTNYPDSEIPILSDMTNMVQFDADTKGIISMTARWKFKDLSFRWNE